MLGRAEGVPLSLFPCSLQSICQVVLPLFRRPEKKMVTIERVFNCLNRKRCVTAAKVVIDFARSAEHQPPSKPREETAPGGAPHCRCLARPRTEEGVTMSSSENFNVCHNDVEAVAHKLTRTLTRGRSRVNKVESSSHTPLPAHHSSASPLSLARCADSESR